MTANLKATNEQIIAAYRSTGSVWAAAKKLGMGGQSVWERLRALGHKMPTTKWTAGEVAELRLLVDQMKLTDIAVKLGRPYAGVACMASRLGICSRVGNRMKRKVPRGSGLTKPVVNRLLSDLEASAMSIRKFCRARHVDVELFARAVQCHFAERWRLIAWGKGLQEKECPGCGIAFFPMTTKQRTCTRRCSDIHRRDIEYFGGRRREAVGMKEGVCQLCLQEGKSLSAHHMLGKQNDPENEWLIALCAGCHQLVGIAAGRKFFDANAGWERFIELVMARRLAEQDGEFFGTHVCVDIEFLTQDDLVTLGLMEEAETGADFGKVLNP